MVQLQDRYNSAGFAPLFRNQAEITVLMCEWPGITGATLREKEEKASSLPLRPLRSAIFLAVCLSPPVQSLVSMYEWVGSPMIFALPQTLSGYRIK